MSKHLTNSQLQAHNLDESDLKVLNWINDRKPVSYMADQLDEKDRTTRRRIEGLMGRTEGIPKKYHKQDAFVRRLSQRYSGALKYQLNWRGMEVISDDLPNKNDIDDNEEISLPDDNKSSKGERVRPHWLLSKHSIRSKPGSWDDEFVIDDKKQIYTERNYKELPDGSVEEHLTTYYDGYEIQIFKDTVNVRVDFPESSFTPQRLWRKYRSRVKEILGFVEDRFGIQLVSRPENVECCMRGQHWADVSSVFADWVWEDEDLQDDQDGVLFHVYDEDEDLMALVDASKGEPEFEFVHTQEAVNHLSNMKDLIRWGGYYEITPKDFKSLAWLRENKVLFENVVGRLDDVDELDSRLDDIRSELDLARDQVEGVILSVRELRSKTGVLEEDVSGLSSEVEDLGVSVKSNEDLIDGLSEQVQRNRDEFYSELNDQSERIDESRAMAQDVVERVDYVRQDVSDNEERIEKVRSDMAEQVREDYELIQEHVDAVSGRVNGVVQQNQRIKSNQEDIMQELKMQREQNARKMDQLIEEQQKTFVDRVKDNMESMKGAVSAVVASIF